jgi:hypothetical protein
MTAKAAAWLVAVALLLGACEKEPTAGSPDCGLPTPQPGLDASFVPERLLIGGEPTSASRERGGFLVAVSIPYSVEEGLRLYKKAVAEEGFKILSEDNEIFEAELYLQDRKRLGAIQIRRSLCDDESIAFVNVISSSKAGQPVPLPIPSGARTPTVSPTG